MIRRSMAACLVAAIVVAGAALTPESVRAEGRCPPGQYPIGGQGVGGCAPIPGGAEAADAGPRATGRWIKTWGAIALSPSGASGASTGKKSKSLAAKDAEEVCAKGGASGCKVAFTYKNQCAVAVVPKSGTGGLFSVARRQFKNQKPVH